MVEKRLNKTIVDRAEKVNKERELRLFFETLGNKPQLIDTWDENLWITLIEKRKYLMIKCVQFSLRTV